MTSAKPSQAIALVVLFVVLLVFAGAIFVGIKIYRATHPPPLSREQACEQAYRYHVLPSLASEWNAQCAQLSTEQLRCLAQGVTTRRCLGEEISRNLGRFWVPRYRGYRIRDSSVMP